MKITKALPCTGVCLLAILLFCGRAIGQTGPSTPGSPTGNPSGAKDSGLLGDSRHFLWYTGHWSKTKKNVFIVDKSTGLPGGGASGGDGSEGDGGTGGLGSGGGTVTVNPDGSVSISGPGVDQWNKKVGDAQKQIDDYVQQLSSPANNADLRTQHLSDQLLPDAQEQQQLWEGYKIDKQQDVLSPDTKPANDPKGSNGGSGSNGAFKPPPPQRTMNDVATEACTAYKSDYQQVMAYYNSIKHSKDADLNVPPPPEFTYDCYVCDSDRRKVYDTTIAHYVRDFSHPEDSMIRKALHIMKAFVLLNGSEDVLNPEVYQAFNKSGACYYMSYGEMNNAAMDIMIHLYRRAEKLVDKYRKDWKAGTAIARTFLDVARNYELLSGNSSSVDQYFPELAGIFAKEFDYYYQQLRHNDWKQIANIPYVMALLRQRALLGSNSEDAIFEEYLAKLKAIMNGFVLTIDMDTKFGKEQGYWLSHVKGQCFIGPDFEKDSNQCYKWVVLDENRPDPLGFYRTKALPEIDCKLIANEMTGSQYSPVYVGSKKYTINLQGLRMDFCSPGQDTIILSRFYPNPKDSGWWRIPHAPLQNLGISGEQFFTDVKRQKQLVDNGEAQKAANDYQSQNEDMIAKMKDMAQKMKSDTGKKTFQDYQKLMEMANQVKQSANNGILAKIMFLDFELPVQNNQQVLVDEKFDGKKINPEAAGAVIYAYFTVHIENKGNPAPKQPASQTPTPQKPTP